MFCSGKQHSDPSGARTPDWLGYVHVCEFLEGRGRVGVRVG